MRLPDTVSLALHQRLTKRWRLLLDVTWTDWSKLQAIEIDFDNPLTPRAVEPLNWEDTYRVSFGHEYVASEDWTARLGFSYGESPVPNARFRSPRLPGNDRRWVTVGASRHLSPRVSLDMSYAHIFIKDTAIRWEESTGETIRGKYDSTSNNLSVALSFRF